ncbi:hypothetical protein SLNWT_4061 [Streptomyces albus]|uniref:Uncharacterized protein n=1 Tax=Streptomyces albus (strain ATCC 21838 / DSM 41398 / FERM P-419 / JCM 4703 / NBRC 107858) TaxID=1081613 RepID=A0A0B5F2A0_STRA4|nr:hypothetical protein SLNWT_4061 [Streptomyces albus]AOU78748.1 hypothetical protein SLNHY_4057 [Streptomyces albus]
MRRGPDEAARAVFPEIRAVPAGARTLPLPRSLHLTRLHFT